MNNKLIDKYQPKVVSKSLFIKLIQLSYELDVLYEDMEYYQIKDKIKVLNIMEDKILSLFNYYDIYPIIDNDESIKFMIKKGSHEINFMLYYKGSHINHIVINKKFNESFIEDIYK